MTNRTRRGFTLIELMVSVAIVGVLSSVALPSYSNMTLRTRKSERDTVMKAMERSIGAVLIREGRLTLPGGADFDGAPNPSGKLTTHKRPFDAARTDAWKYLDLGIEGDVYHSYSFLAGAPTAFEITAMGDLDGDEHPQTKTLAFEIRDGGLVPDEKNPVVFDPPGDVRF
jgi:prepilin-type N-terminal cleavage/methylation domain-containing protein